MSNNLDQINGGSIELRQFIEKRQEQKAWFELNGYYNGNLDTNGEYRLVTALAKRCALFVDIGYNEGVVSKKFQHFNPDIKIVGFEPNPAMPTNPSDHQIVRLALSDVSNTKAKFFVHPDHSGVSSLNERTQLNPSYRKNFVSFEVLLERLDDVYKGLIPSSHSGDVFLKIDVEGSEAKVFRGAETFFKEKRPVGYFEYSEGWKESGELLQNLFYKFDAIDYRLYRVTPLGLEHIRFFHHSMENYIYQNIFFAPKDYLDTFWKPITIAWDFSQTLFYEFAAQNPV